MTEHRHQEAIETQPPFILKEITMEETLHPINCECHGCMDGRPILFKAQKRDGNWQIVLDHKAARGVVEAKLPGGGLGFIAVLTEVAHLSQERAIAVTESALRKMKMTPQLHLDNDHGHFDMHGKSNAELIQFVKKQTDGCGFAGLIWGDQAPGLINVLKDRGWLIEVLDGHHAEQEAAYIDHEGIAINTAEASAEEHQAFTFNRPETAEAFEVIASELTEDEKPSGFVELAMAWHNEKFPAIAKQLRNLDHVRSIA